MKSKISKIVKIHAKSPSKDTVTIIYNMTFSFEFNQQGCSKYLL